MSSSYTLANVITTDKIVFVTETLAGFTNLTSFQIVASVAAVNIDNIVINAPVAPARVPEPASLAILGLGLGGIAAVRRRKSN